MNVVGGRLGKKPGRKRRSGRKTLMSEINVTPFVDVMLVLLIIFMVTAPLLTTGVQVNLPEVSSKNISGNDKPFTISIKKNGDIYIEKSKIPLDKLEAKLKAITKRNTDTRIFVRGDKAVDYGYMMKVIGAINSSGFLKIALITEK